MPLEDYLKNITKASANVGSDWSKWYEPSSYESERYQRAQRQREDEYRRAMERLSATPPIQPTPMEHIYQAMQGEYYFDSPKGNANTLTLIKKSIKQIKAEAVGEKAQERIQAKIDRLRDAGALAQATILETELQVRVKLMRVGEWKYKVLPYDAIKQYESANKNWDGQGGRYKVHIDLLENYCGITTENETEAKDKIIPDGVLDELDVAKERQVFDKVSVLWVEKIPDPLLLGSIDGCQDFFLICQWGEDVTFDDLIGKK